MYGVLQGSRACPPGGTSSGIANLYMLDLFTRWGTSSGAGSLDFLCVGGGVGTRSGGPTEPSLMLLGTSGGQSYRSRLFPSSRGSRKEERSG